MRHRNKIYNFPSFRSQKCLVASPSSWLAQLLVLGFCLHHVTSELFHCPFDSAIKTNTKPLPNITGSYTAYMEWWDKSTQSFNFRQEYVDQESNMAAIRIYGLYDPGDVYVFISDFNTRQLFTVTQDEQGVHCQATTLEPYDTDSYPTVLVSNGTKEHIASTHTLLHLGAAFDEAYGGRLTVRGKAADIWTGCFQNPATQKTVQTDYYFSVPGWYPSTHSVVPLRSVITTDFQDPSKHSYLKQVVQMDYVYFSPDVTETSIFQAASGMYCEGRKVTPSKPVPRMPESFQFRSELLLPLRHEVSVYDEVYDLDAKLVKVESSAPLGGPGMGVTGLEHMRTAILDFNAGISYLLSSDTGHCDVSPITPDNFNTRLSDTQHIRMATATQFTRFDTGTFVYSGQVRVRGVNCDTWTGQASDFPDGLNATSYWTWYFNTVTWSMTSTQQAQVPVFLDIKIPQNGLEMQFSFQDFREGSTDWGDVDVSQCFHHTESRSLAFSLIGNLGVALDRPKPFRQQMVQKIANVMSVSPLRISNFRSHLDASPPSVTFTLLELPGVKGDVDQPSPSSTTTLDQAVARLNGTITAGLAFLRFYVRNPQNRELVVPIFAAPDSLSQTTQHPNGSVAAPTCASTITTTTGTTSSSLSSSSPSSLSSSSYLNPQTTSSSSSSSSPASSKSSSKATSSSRPPPSVTLLGGVTRMTQPQPPGRHTTDQSAELCKNDNKDSSSWSSKSVAGVCVGVAMLGVVMGVLGVGVVQGWARPCLRGAGRPRKEDTTHSYSMM